MNPLSTVTGILTYPARTAGAVVVAGLRTTSRVVGWAVEQAVDSRTPANRTQSPSDPALVTVPDAPVDPMVATRTPPTQAPAKKAPAKKAPTKKVPASEVPLKSAPTPSMPAALRSVDLADVPAPDATAPARKSPARKSAAKKTPAKKAPSKKAPSKKAAVLAPALGLSEDQVTETLRGAP